MTAGSPRQFRVVSNEAGQYSVWAVDRVVPDGWFVEGTVGDEQACLDRIDTVWTDPVSTPAGPPDVGRAGSGG